MTWNVENSWNWNWWLCSDMMRFGENWKVFFFFKLKLNERSWIIHSNMFRNGFRFIHICTWVWVCSLSLMIPCTFFIQFQFSLFVRHILRFISKNNFLCDSRSEWIYDFLSKWKIKQCWRKKKGFLLSFWSFLPNTYSEIHTKLSKYNAKKKKNVILLAISFMNGKWNFGFRIERIFFSF